MTIIIVKEGKDAQPLAMSEETFSHRYSDMNCPYVAMDETGSLWADTPHFYGEPTNHMGAMGRSDFRKWAANAKVVTYHDPKEGT